MLNGEVMVNGGYSSVTPYTSPTHSTTEAMPNVMNRIGSSTKPDDGVYHQLNDDKKYHEQTEGVREPPRSDLQGHAVKIGDRQVQNTRQYRAVSHAFYHTCSIPITG